MFDNQQKWDLRKGILVVLFIGAIILALLAIRAANEARQTRFNLKVLQRYIKSYKNVEGKQIEDLSQIPDFHIISPDNSLSLSAKDIRKGISSGYVYDMQSLGNGRYVISASPLGFLNSNMEFGITEKGMLKMNNKGVDPISDTYQEVESWPQIPSNEHVRTATLPEYLSDN
jgi:hypothetical protein